jgi:NADPH-dependent ferric siderophore reductase
MARSIRKRMVHPVVLRELDVRAVREVTPGMRRITLGGEQLGGFHNGDFDLPAFVSDGFDDVVRLYFPIPGENRLVLPVQKERTIDWKQEDRSLGRDYTVRRYDPERGEVTVDFAQHVTGVASAWSQRVRPGDRIHIAGPLASSPIPSGVDWYLVAGDETALPAIGRLLEELPDGALAQVFVEVAEPGHEQRIDTGAKAEITWLYRHGRAAGSTTLLADAARTAPWWPGSVYAWVAGEALSIKPIRRYLREVRELPAEFVDVAGYWRRTEVSALDDDPAVTDVSQAPDTPFERLHELGEILPPFAVRVAATLRIPTHVSRGAGTLDQLTELTGADRSALGKLLRYLVTIDVLTQDESGAYDVGELGSEFTDEGFVLDKLDLNGFEARIDLTAAGLLDAVRTGQAVGDPHTGATLREQLESSDRLARDLHAFSEDQHGWQAAAVAGDYPLTGIERLYVHSPGAAAVLDELLARNPHVQATVVGLPSHHDDVRAAITPEVGDRVGYLARSAFQQPPEQLDAYLIFGVLRMLPDADAAMLLSAAGGGARDGRVVLVEPVLDPGDVDEHAAEADLLALTAFGAGLRTMDEVAALAADAGLRVVDHRLVGWGVPVIELAAAPA